jgi:asparagine synthase (glutamine-hydrolysing)
MQHLIDIAYNTALQRLDRAMFANSIHYRTPFLDSEVIAFCLQLPVSWKIHAGADGSLVEKWLLREAFKDLLPEQIYRRQKLRFSGGTGTDVALEALAGRLISEAEFTEEARTTPGGYRLNSPKELHYYRIFKKRFPDPCFEALVGRWDPHK